MGGMIMSNIKSIISSSDSDKKINKPKKIIWKIGNNTVIILAKEIVKELNINENDVMEQTITKDNDILLRFTK